ncbi:transposable element Tcb2 transposase [Trichonephila clavipes]|nr:transposable element Tcb2 transposase [Trichonephila clavipes]
MLWDLSLSQQRNTYLITSICVASKYPEAIPVESITSPNVIDALLSIFSRIGSPREIQSDLGSSFTSELTTIFFNNFGIKVTMPLVSHLQSNAVEKTTRRENRRIVWQALVDPTVTRSTIRADVGVASVPQTISRHLAEANLKTKRPFRALPITPDHRQQRLQWCLARSMWNVTDWQKVVFRDESRFLLGTDDNRVRVWRCAGEFPHTVLRHSARTADVMVWGSIAYDSRSTLIVMHGTLMGLRYVDDILQPNVGPFLNGLPGAIFQQDNARPHTELVSLVVEEVSDDIEGDAEIPYPDKQFTKFDYHERLRESKLQLKLSPFQIDELKQVITKNKDVVSPDPGMTHLMRMDIELISDKPIKTKPYRISPRQINILRKEIKRLLELGVIQIG